MTITNAIQTTRQAEEIATLIMEAMNHECCQYFAGEGHTLHEFHSMMTQLVMRHDSQYSYRNTLVALDEHENPIGCCVSYDGSQLHHLRKAFIAACKQHFNQDFTNMPDETQPGELYIDSLAVDPQHRGKGIARKLLRATIDKAKTANLPAAGLLVDSANPLAERLYRSVGFTYVGSNSWGGHEMRHLQYRIT